MGHYVKASNSPTVRSPDIQLVRGPSPRKRSSERGRPTTLRPSVGTTSTLGLGAPALTTTGAVNSHTTLRSRPRPTTRRLHTSCFAGTDSEGFVGSAAAEDPTKPRIRRPASNLIAEVCPGSVVRASNRGSADEDSLRSCARGSRRPRRAARSCRSARSAPARRRSRAAARGSAERWSNRRGSRPTRHSLRARGSAR